MEQAFANYEVGQYLLENGTELKEDIEPYAGKFFDLKKYFQDNSFSDIFEDKYKDFFCMCLCEKLYPIFSNMLTYEELRCIVTPELVEELNGSEYWDYE